MRIAACSMRLQSKPKLTRNSGLFYRYGFLWEESVQRDRPRMPGLIRLRKPKRRVESRIFYSVEPLSSPRAPPVRDLPLKSPPLWSCWGISSGRWSPTIPSTAIVVRPSCAALFVFIPGPSSRGLRTSGPPILRTVESNRPRPRPRTSKFTARCINASFPVLR